MLKRPITLSKNQRNGVNISNNKTTISTNKNISNSNHLLRLSTSNSISSSNSSNTSSLFKTRLNHLSNLKEKNLTLNLQMTQYTVAPPRNRNKDKEVSHSIYSRFEKEFRKTFTSNLNSQLESMSKVLYTINPKKYPQFKLKKELIRKQTLELNPNQAQMKII